MVKKKKMKEKEFVLCILCKKKVGYKFRDVSLWCESAKIDHDDMTMIMLEMAKDYPKTKKIIINVCPDCFKKKLIPWFESQGAKIEEHDFIYG